MTRHHRRRFWIFIVLRTLANSMIIFGVVFLFALFWPFISVEIQYRYSQIFGREKQATIQTSGFGDLLKNKKEPLPPLNETPKNTDFGIIIEKINVNAPVVKDVDSSDPVAYLAALKIGAAHAKGTALPGDTNKANNNVFIFAHSTLNIWDVAKYNAIFILLRELTPGDRVTTFYQGRRYDYEVTTKQVVEATDVRYLTTPSKDPILTLQTCDPPGTSLRRLIITANLVGGG